VNQRVPHKNDEATLIARLIGLDGKSIVGLVFVWEASELAILWLKPEKTATFVEPEFDPEMLAKCKQNTPRKLFSFLGKLQTHVK